MRTQANLDTVEPLARHRVVFSLFRALEVCGVIVSLFVLTNGIIPFLFQGGRPNAESSSEPILAVSVIYWGFYAFTLAQVVLRPRAMLKCASSMPFPIALVVWALLSATWSIAPNETLRRSFAFTMATLFGIYLASRFSSRELVRLLAGVLGTCAVLSAAVALLLPAYGVGTGALAGNWQGTFQHKNTLGEMMLLAAVIFRSLPGRSAGSRIIGWSGFALAVALVVLSRSITALIVLATVSLMMTLLRRFRHAELRSALMMISVCLICVTVLLTIVDREVALSLTGKDITLTGRTDIWSAVIRRIAERPLLGYGYDAFWLPTAGPGESIRREIKWATPHSHNGFLDFGVDLGLVGVLLLVGALAHTGRRVWARWRPQLGTSGDWALALVIVILLMDVTESLIYAQSNFAWVLFVTVAAATVGDPVIARPRRRAKGAPPRVIVHATGAR
jgi:exopolysaccharide production protein ExoQ